MKQLFYPVSLSSVLCAIATLLFAIGCKSLKTSQEIPQQIEVETSYLQRADVIGGTELDSGRFEVLVYHYFSQQPNISDTWYSKEIFVRLQHLSNLPVGQSVAVPNEAFAVISYDRATWDFEQFKGITGTITRLNASSTQPEVQVDLQYIGDKKQVKPLLQGTFTFQLDSTYFQCTRKDYKGQYDDLRLALKEPAKVKSLDLVTYAIQYEKRNGQNSGPDTLYNRLGELFNLEMLNLNLSHLPKLPAGLQNLKRLKKLDLGYNQLTQFPTELYQLDSLQELNLEWNRIDSIPASVSQLKSLRVLNLDDNRLDRYPQAVNGLTNLRELYLGNANLRTIPASIRQLQRLEVLEVNSFWKSKRRNRVTNIDALQELPQLRRLSLKDNPLDSLPAAVYRLSKLEELNIQYTGLDSTIVNRQWLPLLKKLK